MNLTCLLHVMLCHVMACRWTPWPESIPRNAQIFSRISHHDRQVGTPHIYNGSAALHAKRLDIFKYWFVEKFHDVGIRADKLSDMRLCMHRIWLETTQQSPHFFDNRNVLNNVSDTFDLSIVIDDNVRTIQLHMMDLLYSSSSSSSLPSSVDPISDEIRKFCRQHITDSHGNADVRSCQRSVANFAFRWVMESNLF
jgi:hypothetical protein